MVGAYTHNRVIPRPCVSRAEGVRMNEKKLSESLADALDSIANMPVVIPDSGLTVGQVTNAYHEALQIARDAMKFYKRQTKAAK